jgi:hypothetical protein
MTPTGTTPRKSLRALKFIGATLLLLLALGTVAVFFFLDSLALLIAKPLLAPYGLRLQNIEGLQLHRGQVALESLRFTLDGADESSQIDRLDIHFSDTGLMALPIQQLRAERVSIGLAASTTNDSMSDTLALPRLPRIGELLDTLQAIPGNAVEIERLDIAPYIVAGKLSVSRDTRELHVQVAAQDTSADFRVNWHDAGYDSSLRLPEQGLGGATSTTEVISGRLLLGALGEQVLSTDFTLSEHEQRLQIDARSLLQLDALSAFAQQASLLADPLLSVTGQLDIIWHFTEPASTDNQQIIPFSANIAALSAVDSTLRSELPSGLHSVSWRNTEELSARGEYTLATQALELRLTAPAMSIALGIGQAPPAQLSASLDELNVDCSDSLTCHISHSSSLRLHELTWLDTGVRDLLLVSNGTLALEQGHYDLHFAQGSRLEFGSLHTAAVDLTQVNALVQQDLDLSIAADGSVQLDSGGVDLYLPDISTDGKTSQFASTISQLSGRLSTTETQLQAHVQMRNIGSEWLPFIFRKSELEFDFNNQDKELSAKGALRIADRELAQFDVTLDTDAFSGMADFETPILNFGSGEQSLARLFFQKPFEADIVSGSLQSRATLQIRRDENGAWLLNGPMRLDADKISGFYQDTAIIEFSTALSGTLQDSADFLSDGLRPFSLARIDLGLPVESISLQYGIDTLETRLNVQDIEASLFGGRIHSTGLAYDWSAARNSVTIDVERIDISRLLTLADYDSVRATGFVSGTIPITLEGTKPSVGAGRLRVEAPGGAIHYSPAGGINSGNASLDLVNQALSNYQYSLMETEVEYLPSGDLALGVKLQGRNPDLNNGQRINLNLNISDNIPTLLRSLQSGRSIAEAVERQLQAR